ncbi:MAG: DUF4384 domain-containing protein, partial [Candidatus Zixiibacteriota bacterium]
MRQRESQRGEKRGGWYSALLMALFAAVGVTPSGVRAQSDVIEREYQDNSRYDNGVSIQYADYIEYDPTLEVEIWTDNESGYYYQRDEIKIYFRASDDCYVAVYNVDTEGRVNLIYPFDKYDDPFIEGGRIYRIPDAGDDYDLVLRGPAGAENIQIVASRTPFPVPDWYEGSGLVSDRDRYEFLEYVNGRYFGCRSGCPRAYDQVSFVVREWDNYYYRPVYYHPWPVWRHYGGVYIDYYWGSTIYVDGYYYGIAPLYLPRVSLGHHVVTVCDPYGHFWESSVYVSHHARVRLDNTIIRTGAGVKSRYRSVNRVGYRNPAKHGYSGVKINRKYRPKTEFSVTKSALGSKGTSKKLVRKSHGDDPVRGFGSKKAYRPSDGSAGATRTTLRKSVKKSKKSSKASTTEGKRLKVYKKSSKRSSKKYNTDSKGAVTKKSSRSSFESSKKVYKSRGSKRSNEAKAHRGSKKRSSAASSGSGKSAKRSKAGKSSSSRKSKLKSGSSPKRSSKSSSKASRKSSSKKS